MSTYGLTPRRWSGPLWTRLRAVAWVAVFYASLRVCGWLIDRTPKTLTWAVGVGRFVWSLCLLVVVFNLLRVVLGDMGGRKYRETFRVTVTPEGVHRVSSSARERDVFFPRDEITGFYDARYFVRVLTRDPFRHLTIRRDLDRYDDFKHELVANGILPVIPNTNRSPAVLLLMCAVGVCAAGCFLAQSARTPSRLIIALPLAIAGATVTTRLFRRSADQSPMLLWLVVSLTAFEGFDNVMLKRGHDFGDLSFVGLLLSAALPWVISKLKAKPE